MSSIMKKLIRIYLAIEKNKLIVSIRQSFALMVPIFLTGAFVLVIEYFPVDAIQNFVATALNGSIKSLCEIIYNGTFGMAAFYVLIILSYKYYANITRKVGVYNVLASLTSIAAYVALMGTSTFIDDSGSVNVKAFILDYTGVKSIFTALVVSAVSTKLLHIAHRFMDKKGKVANGIALQRKIYGAYIHTLPIVVISLLFGVLSLFISWKFKVEGFNELLINVFSAPFNSLGRSIWSGVLVQFFEGIFWFFGVHGGNVFETIVTKVFSENSGEILTKSFFDVFVTMGGCGTTVSLVLTVLLISKSKSSKKLCAKSVLPLLFNVNEMIVFGLPIVLNPVYIVPFVLTPVALTVFSYLMITWGVVPPAVNAVRWTTPVFISGYMSTGSVAGSILQLISIAMGICIYAPFVKLSDRLQVMSEESKIKALVGEIKRAEKISENVNLTKDRDDTISLTAEDLYVKLYSALSDDSLELYYQPQVDRTGKVKACEALLRWKYNGKSFLYPPLIIKLAREKNIIKELNDVLVQRALNDSVMFEKELGTKMNVSVNFQSDDINADFAKKIVGLVRARNFKKVTFCVEFTEDSKLVGNKYVENEIKFLKENGILVAVDDFSMGHTSLTYLQSSKFDYIKLDGCLVRNMMDNLRSRNIISSIIKLGADLGFDVIAEYVETKEQRDMLEEMGCYIYQGYYYSPALTPQEFVDYVKKMNAESGKDEKLISGFNVNS